MTDVARVCTICGTAASDRPWRPAGDASLWKCSTCGFARIEGGEPWEVLATQYLGNETSRSEYYTAADLHAQATFAIRMERLKRVTGLQHGRVLDVGSSVGSFLKAATAAGWSAVGIEPNAVAADTARQAGFTVQSGFFTRETAEGLGAFDAVHMGDVLEHTADPIGFIRLGLTLLKPAGALIAVTPDLNSLMGRLLQIKPCEHLVYFTRQSLELAAKAAGCREVSVERWGRLRSMAAMRYSTTFSGPSRILVSAVDVPIVRPLVEQTLFKCFRDELLLVARSPDEA